MSKKSMNPSGQFANITANMEKVMRGQAKAIRLSLVALVSGGHVLLNDYPGTGKTTLSKTLALSVEGIFKRIQFTPDLLPSDITGLSIYDQSDKTFKFHKGPVFANIVLADEINRASPRTQSALLEAMAEGQVSIDGIQHNLEELFFVIATQNPIESHGTYPLPEAQMDRFAFNFSLGYVSPEEETAILSDQAMGHPVMNVSPCATAEDILTLRKQAQEIEISDEIKRYIVDLVNATRSAEGVRLGASPRASLTLMKASQVMALMEEMDFVTADHVQEIALYVIAHRLALDSEARFSGVTGEAIVEDLLKAVPVPV
ncbi:MAG: MoxR family ATPase [Deltaproteobacteria bacterium]|nr:MoxR family ATPase [Deltaproteobacteria bacterium]